MSKFISNLIERSKIMEENTIGIYIHIPFCKQKCFYCDFTSYCNKDNYIDKYIMALKKEIEFQKIPSKIDTIYIGGGTPSYIDCKYIEQILDELKKKEILENAEISIEVNPGTITKEKINLYKKCGINRISIGLQSTNNRILKQIGRIHNYSQFLQTYQDIRAAGIQNINIDLMLGLPNQSIKDLKQSLKKIIELKPEHISVYSLIIEENTPIENKIKKGELLLPDEETERNMYWYVKNTLELNGYNHYEISNFETNGYISKHNMNCWEQKEYIGFGVSAHSYYNKTRYSNTEDIEQYIRNIENKELDKNKTIHEIQDEYDTRKEFMLLGLRKIQGISISEFKNKFGDNPIYIFRNELIKLFNQNLITIDADTIKLTNKGINLANLVWEEFV